MVLICKNGLWRVYATRWVGLGLWGRCVLYVHENCVSYALQQISYHMHAKTAYYMHAKHMSIIYTPKSIFPVFSVTWFFRNHSNMLICCSRNIVDYFWFENSCAASYCSRNRDTFFNILWWKKVEKKHQHLFKIEIFYSIYLCCHFW